MKILTLVLLLLPFAVYAEPVDMLDFQINELTRRRDELRAEIERCKKNTKKFKIAGVSTLGATGVGVVGNIALHNKIKNMGSGGSGGGAGAVADTRTEAQKVDYECQMFCSDDAGLATEMGCEC
jgi:hypothetical protein